MGQVGRKWQPYRTASRFVPLESTQNQDSMSLIGPSFKYLSILSTRATFDASVQRGGYWWPDIPWTEDVRRQDLATTATRGAFLETDRQPRRWQYGGTFAYFAEAFGRNHELKSRLSRLAQHRRHREHRLSQPAAVSLSQRDRRRRVATKRRTTTAASRVPDSVLVYDYPNTTASGEWYNSLYLNDKITLSRKMTLNVGVRYDRYSSFLPEQGNPGTGPFATPNIYPYQGESNFPIYSSLVPRISAVYDITGEGRVAVRASYGRYTGGSSGAAANPGVNAADINPNAIITRTYSNWNGTIPYVPNPANLTSTAGGGTNRSIDPDLKGPFVDEYTAGLDLGLSRVVTMQFNYVRKIDGNGNQTVNLALPYDAYTVTRTGIDPGRDNVAGTADDQTLTVYSVPNTYPTFGQSIERVVQASGNNRYHAMGATLNKQFSNNYSFLVGFDADYRDLRDNAPRNPNEALYGPQNGNISGTNTGTSQYQFNRSSWNYAFRMSGTYMLPWGFSYSSSFTSQSGDYYFREVQIRDALNTNVAIRIEPQADRYAWTKIWDNRVTKKFKTWGNQSIEGSFDLFNTLNMNTITAQTNRVGSAAYLQPTEILAPRIARLGVKYRF